LIISGPLCKVRIRQAAQCSNIASRNYGLIFSLAIIHELLINTTGDQDEMVCNTQNGDQPAPGGAGSGRFDFHQ
jgi:hypothetical protein